MAELMALLKFIMPKLFSDRCIELDALFSMRSDIEDNESFLSKERIERAKKIMAPFVLRRRKADVLPELPKKIERIQFCPMSDEQKALYDLIFVQSAKSLNEEIPTKKKTTLIFEEQTNCDFSTHTHGKMSRKFNNILMQLRKAANHRLLHRSIFTSDNLAIMAKCIMRVSDCY